MIDMLESTPQVKDARLYINGEPLIEHGGEELQQTTVEDCGGEELQHMTLEDCGGLLQLPTLEGLYTTNT